MAQWQAVVVGVVAIAIAAVVAEKEGRMDRGPPGCRDAHSVLEHVETRRLYLRLRGRHLPQLPRPRRLLHRRRDAVGGEG